MTTTNVVTTNLPDEDNLKYWWEFPQGTLVQHDHYDNDDVYIIPYVEGRCIFSPSKPPASYNGLCAINLKNGHGYYVFNDDKVWKAVPAGTKITITAGKVAR